MSIGLCYVILCYLGVPVERYRAEKSNPGRANFSRTLGSISIFLRIGRKGGGWPSTWRSLADGPGATFSGGSISMSSAIFIRNWDACILLSVADLEIRGALMSDLRA